MSTRDDFKCVHFDIERAQNFKIFKQLNKINLTYGSKITMTNS